MKPPLVWGKSRPVISAPYPVWVGCVISGGQTGVDQGALEGAQRAEIMTYGWMPKGFITENGPNPALAKRFRLQEHTSVKYPPRTARNIKEAHATIILAADRGDRGTALTKKLCEQYDRPSLLINMLTQDNLLYCINELKTTVAHKIAQKLGEDTLLVVMEGSGLTLNFAGPRESKCPGIQRHARWFVKNLCLLLNADFDQHVAAKPRKGKDKRA